MDDKVINLTEKLYQYRDTVKTLHKEKFWEVIAPFQNILKNYSDRKRLDILPACMEIIKKDKDADPHMVVLFIAAAVELIDPSNEKKDIQARS